MAENPEAPKPDFSALYRTSKPYAALPFDSSVFDYRPFADRVIQAFSVLAHGAVLAIDAPWGYGKTFFGLNFKADLQAKGWRTAYIDAFEHDFVEDPFLLLASVIKEQASEPKRGGFVHAAAGVGRALLPLAAKAAVKAATLKTLDLKEVEEAFAEGASDAAFKFIEGRITEFEKELQSVKRFKEKLAETAEEVRTATQRPLVVFIDELDRCRPDFAVRTLERMKHFFDVPSLIFVLLLNRRQMENAVNGLYGAELDASAYLRKFVHASIDLPFSLAAKHNPDPEIKNYPKQLAEKIDLGPNEKLLAAFTIAMQKLAPTLGLSFRDIERAYTEFVLAVIKARVSPDLMFLLAFVITLKVSYPDMYAALLKRNLDERRSAELLAQAKSRGLDGLLYEWYRGMIQAHLNMNVQINDLTQFLRSVNLELEDAFSFFARLINSRRGD
jgi:hypothetical protein